MFNSNFKIQILRFFAHIFANGFSPKFCYYSKSAIFGIAFLFFLKVFDSIFKPTEI